MRIHLLSPLSVFLLFLSCSSEPHQIRVACDNSVSGIYTVKWELFPSQAGTVKIYESVNPTTFGQEVLVGEKAIESGYSIIQRPDDQRRFYRLVFNKKCTAYVGERHIPMEKMDNFRDLGGYFNGKNKQIRWGKLFRSGSLFRTSDKDKATLDSMHIKTVVDLRDHAVIKKYPSTYNAPRMDSLCLQGISTDSIFQKVLAGQMKKGDVLIALQDLYGRILKEDKAYLMQMFNILLEEENYPVLFHCSIGKDRAGVISILILEALGIDKDQIFHDYMLSNQYINFNRAISLDPNASAEAQEALTTLLKANEQLFNFVYERTRMDYGSIQEYLVKELGLTDKKRSQLKEILFY